MKVIIFTVFLFSSLNIFSQYCFVTDNSKIFGIIVSETDSSITLRLEDYNMQTIKRNEIIEKNKCNCIIIIKESGTALNGHIKKENDSVFTFIGNRGTKSYWNIKEIKEIQINKSPEPPKQKSKFFIYFPGYDIITKHLIFGGGIYLNNPNGLKVFYTLSPEYATIALEGFYSQSIIDEIYLLFSLGIQGYSSHSNAGIEYINLNASIGVSIYNFHVQYGIFSDNIDSPNFFRISYLIDL